MTAATEEKTEREYAAMAEGLGKKLKTPISGGKAPLLKILQVRVRAKSSLAPPSSNRVNND